MFFVYTDASFRNTDRLGVIGFLLLESDDEPLAVDLAAGLDVQCLLIKESNNIRCELRAILEVMRFLEPRYAAKPQPVHIITDCQAISKLPSRRENLEKNQFLSRRSGQSLSNADLYRDFFSFYDLIKPLIHWTNGHSSAFSKDTRQINFSVVDRAVRQQLRNTPLRSIDGDPRLNSAD